MEKNILKGDSVSKARRDPQKEGDRWKPSRPLQGPLRLGLVQKEGRLESPVCHVSGWQRGFSHGNDSSAVGERELRPRQRALSKGSQLSTPPGVRAPAL